MASRHTTCRSNIAGYTDAYMEGITLSGVKWDGGPHGEMVVYKDKSGNEVQYMFLDGVNVATFFPLRFMQQIKGFKFRPDDVYLPGFPRTGTNWTHEMTQMLMNRKAETIRGLKPHLELMSVEDIDKLPSPRVVNAHVKMSEAPDDLREKKCKIIFTLRDPRDVAVSLYSIARGLGWEGVYYRGSFEDYLSLFLEGKIDWNGIFEHWRAAEKFFDENPEIPVHFQVYEETIQNSLQSVQKLSDFLGLPRDDDLCKAIADKCAFKNMKVDKDPYTLKTNGMDVLFRKGTSGDWRNYFSEELLDEYFRVYDEKMSGSRFYDMYARKD